MYTQTSEQTRTIWMDGRPHPPAYAPHSWTGFATGAWAGHILTVHTTHLKRAWLRVNGVPQSDAATVDEYFTRHGDRITYVSVVTDPVYLAEPWIRSVDFVRAPRDPASWLYACDDAEQIVGRPDDVIPSHLFGQNPYLREYAAAAQSAAARRARRTGDHAPGVHGHPRHRHRGGCAPQAPAGGRALPRERRARSRSARRRDPRVAGAGQRLHARGRRRQHRRPDRRPGRARRRHRRRPAVGQGRRRHPHAQPQTDPVHRQHELPPGPHGRQRRRCEQRDAIRA